MDYSFANMRKSRNVVRGMAEYLMVAPKSWFAANGIKSPVGPFTSKGDMITVKAPHVFNTGKGFIYIQLAPQKNKLESKASGDPGLATVNTSIDVFIPGSDAESHEFMQQYLNIPLIGLHKDANCQANLIYQLGCDCTSAYLTWDFSTGTTKDGVKGFAGKLDYEGALQFYQVDGGPTLLAD